MSTAIVIGGGHNGLAAAYYLARAGRSVVLLERRDEVGGGAVTGVLHPEFHCPTLTHNVLIHDRVSGEMDLRRHGLELLATGAASFTPSPNGPIVLHHEAAETVERLRAISGADAQAYAAYSTAVRGAASVLAAVLESPPPPLDGAGASDLWNLVKAGRVFRGLTPRDRHRLLRWLPMPSADFTAEWFETEALRAIIAAPGLSGTMLGPRSAGSTLVMMLGLAHQQLAGGLRRVRGGPGALTRAMATAARLAGVTIRTGASVERIVVSDGRADGVVVDGQMLAAGTVISTLDPRTTLLGLVDPAALGPGIRAKLANYRAHGTVTKVNLALSALPRFDGVTETAALSGRIHIGPTLDYLERAFDHAKYGEVSAEPWLEMTIPSIVDPGLAPASAHVASIYVHYTPRRLRGGQWPVVRDEVQAATLRVLERYAPGISSLVVASQVITPEDLERDYGMAGGHIFHGELAPDQLFTMRPLLGYGRYESPVPGLYLGGAGTHPGGFLTGAAGRLAARQALRAR